MTRRGQAGLKMEPQISACPSSNLTARPTSGNDLSYLVQSWQATLMPANIYINLCYGYESGTFHMPVSTELSFYKLINIICKIYLKYHMQNYQYYMFS